jgi:voltage-gated potassium channel
VHEPPLKTPNAGLGVTTLERLLAPSSARKPLTARRAALTIGIVTLVVTVISGVAMRFVDGRQFDNVWLGLWWALQTVTTVGYGDITPTTVPGRVVAGLVMLTGIGFLTVVTAAITAALVEGARRRMNPRGPSVAEQLDEVNARLKRLEELLGSGERRRV